MLLVVVVVVVVFGVVGSGKGSSNSWCMTLASWLSVVVAKYRVGGPTPYARLVVETNDGGTNGGGGGGGGGGGSGGGREGSGL